MTSMPEALDAYLDAVRQSADGLTPDLCPGRSAAAVRRILQDCVDEPVDELVDLYSWHDGEFEPYSGTFWSGGGIFRPLDRVEEELALSRQCLRDDRAVIQAEGHAWPFSPADAVPIVYAGLAFTLVDCGTGSERGSVYHYDNAAACAPVLMFPSLSDAIDAARFCVEAGHWQPVTNGRYVETMQAVGRVTGVSRDDLSSPPFPMGR